MRMKNKKSLLVGLLVLLLLGSAVVFFTAGGSDSSPFLTARAERREIRVMVSTNGIIEPADRSEIYAQVDGLVASVHRQEGEEVGRGEVLMRLDSAQIRSALTEANAALLAARRQARAVSTGPSREEIAAVDAEIAETELQLEQARKDLLAEESLYQKQATTRIEVEKLKKQTELLEVRVGGLRQKKQDLLARYSAEEKEWEQGRIKALEKEVDALEKQLRGETVTAPIGGVVYSLPVKPGSYVNRGTLLAQIYRPGNVRLRAYVDEPDLGRIQEGQQVVIEWDGLPERRWTGRVEKPARQVVPLNSRSIGHVFCSIDGDTTRLIPNLNVKVEIATMRKTDAIVVPRAAVFNHNGEPSVMVATGAEASIRPVKLGLVTADEIEIVSGIDEGTSVILNHAEVKQVR